VDAGCRPRPVCDQPRQPFPFHGKEHLIRVIVLFLLLQSLHIFYGNRCRLYNPVNRKRVTCGFEINYFPSGKGVREGLLNPFYNAQQVVDLK
jgi:hypothetical protein